MSWRNYSRAAEDGLQQAAREWVDADEAPSGHAPIADNEAHAPGKVCELCNRAIEAGQDARLRPDGHWIHEACPIQPED